MARINFVFIIVLLCLCYRGNSLDPCEGEHWFRCGTGRCLEVLLRCDGVNDCGDNSDELNCSESISPENIKCSPNEFRCKNDNCIPLEKFCNKQDDCFDNSDEYEGCITNKTCSASEFRCANGYCIHPEWLCDGQDDCTDNSDEMNCESHSVENCTSVNDLYLCTNGRCIAASSACNKRNDCGDNSDEHETGCSVSLQKCTELHCSDTCRPTPKGPFCSCPLGHRLMNNHTCQDINECLETPEICDQHCVNEIGSYYCLCDIAYDLQPDNRTCRVSPDRGDALLVFSTMDEIRGLYLPKHEIYFSIARNLKHAVGVSIDANYVYWSDVYQNDETIFRAHEDGSSTEVIVTAGLGKPEEIAVDWITGNIYFTDSLYMRIGVCTNDGSHCTIVITENAEKPRGLALHPATGEMYWSDWGSKPHISRAEMNGKSRFPLVTSELGWPNGLTIDYPGSKLYWVDPKRQIIESINLDGTGRKVVLQTFAKHPFSIAVFEDKLYWSDWETKNIHSCHKFTGKDERTLIQEVDEIYGIHIYHSVLKPDLHNPCNAGPCAELCLLAADHNYTCACSPDKYLAEDKRSCRQIQDVRHQYLMIAAGGIFIDYYHEILGKPNMTGTYTFHHFAAAVYDSVDESILVSDERSSSISRYDPIQAESKRLFDIDNGIVGGMAFDRMGNNLYWSDVQHKTIEIHSLSSSEKTTLHFSERPTSILLIPEFAMMYVAFCAVEECHIDKMSMTGSGRTQVLMNLRGPRISLVFDSETNRIFWADQGTGRIESISIDGNDRRLLHSGLKEPVSIAILGDEVFWSLRHSKRIFWSYKHESLTRNKGITLMIPTLVDVIHLIATGPQPSLNIHKCRMNNGGCSHVCLVETPHLHICRCPTGMTLNSDMRTCVPETSCSSDEIQCSDDHSCIDRTRLCDGADDCHNGEDEENCGTNACSTDEFQCRSSECIPKSRVCDGVSQCSDESDEANCANHICHSNSFRCPSGTCIPKSWECDGQRDCEDGSDETLKCKRLICPKSMFTCNNHKCVDAELICNAVDDCGDNSDELHCTKEVSVFSGHCAVSEYRCMGTDKCIPMDSRCDGEQDCPKNDDEHHCSHCASDEFACTNLKCIPRLWMCDDADDCGDGSDEKGCDDHKIIAASENTSCPEFKCMATGRCIPFSFVCDGMSDCFDGTDENGQCSSACSIADCEQLCQRTPSGPICQCESGYLLKSDGRTCEDVDECVSNACSQLCRNKIGSYDCSCFDGYVLRGDRTTCKVAEGSMEFITATKDDVRRIPVSLDIIEVVHRQPHVEITGLDINVERRSLYWSSELLGTIHEFNLRSKEHKRIGNIGRPRILAVDWITDNVYYFDTEKPEAIKVCTFAERKCAEVLKIDGSGSVMSLAVEPRNGFLFWGQTSFINYDKPTSEIWRMDLNGEGITNIAREDLGIVSGITIDHDRAMLYWVDAALQVIERAKLDGSGREVFLKDQVYQPIGVNIFEDAIYWLMGSSGTLKKCSLVGERECESILVKSNNVQELFVILHKSRQPVGINNCENHKCEYMCVQKNNSSICICHDGSIQNLHDKCTDTNVPVIEFATNSLQLKNSESFGETKREAGPFTAIVIIIAVGIAALSSYCYYQRHKSSIRSKYDLSIHFQNPSFNNTPGITSDYIVPIIPPSEHEYINPMNEHAVKVHESQQKQLKQLINDKNRIELVNSDQSDNEFVNDEISYNKRLIKP